MRIAITGATGFLGSHLTYLWRLHEVLPIVHNHCIGIKHLVCDLSDTETLVSMLSAERIEWLVHCAALTDHNTCQSDSESAIKSNVHWAQSVAEACRRSGTRMLYISTDAVFDGRRGFYTEDDIQQAISVYGASKSIGEYRVLAEYTNNLVVRGSFFGLNTHHSQKKNIANFFYLSLRFGHVMNGWINVFFNPLFVNDYADMLMALMQKGASGVYHLGAANFMSKYDFGVFIARELGLSDSMIGEVDNSSPIIPKISVLNTHKAQMKLGRGMPTIESGIKRMLENDYLGMVEDIRGMISDRQPEVTQ